MPLYSYKVRDSKGRIIEDVAQAANKKEAATMLKSDNFQILTLKKLDSKSSFLQGRISTSEKAAFCRFIATMLRAGLPLPEAIDIIRQETSNKKLKKILFDMAFNLKKGNTMYSVLSKYDSEFDSVFLTIVKAGEESGNLDQAFDYLSKQLLTSYELSQKVKGSLMYPIIIVAAMLVNAVLMMTFVLPKLSGVFTQLNVDLPRSTELLLNLGNFMGENVFLVLAVFSAFMFAFFLLFYFQRTRVVLTNLFLQMPIVNKVARQIDVARFSRTLSTLLKSGVSITAALEVAADVLRLPNLKSTAYDLSKGVQRGESISDLLSVKKNAFPIVMVQTVRAGEKTGSLEIVLEEMATFYESEIDYALKRATSLLEPILLLFIGVGVGAMAVMMITPIYSVVGGLEGQF